MKIKVFKTISFILRVIMILLASLLVFIGFQTMFLPLTHVETFGFLYESRIGLVVAGTIIAGSGLTLLIGKVFRRPKWVATGLYAIFSCFLFAAITNAIALGIEYAIGNAVMAVVVAGLILWWKFKTGYISKHELYRDVLREHPELHP